MNILSIYNESELEVLRKQSSVVLDIESERNLIDNLKQFLIENENANGISAPQLGVNKNIFAIKSKTTGCITVYINPVIKKYYDSKEHFYREGCLSLGEKLVVTKRAKMLKVMYQDEGFNVIKRLIKDDEAVVYQHELDHLLGILINDRDQINSKSEEE